VSVKTNKAGDRCPRGKSNATTPVAGEVKQRNERGRCAAR